jgi:hypothetical protein
MPADAVAFATALATSHLMTVVKVVELVCGLLLLSGRFVPLALALLAPVLVGILHFHLVFEPAGVAIGAFALVLELFLVWSYREAFAPMLRPRATASV